MLVDLNVEIFQWIHAGSGTRPFVDGVAAFFAQGGPWIMACFFIALYFFVNRNKRISLLQASWSAILGLIINWFIALFYFHPRPFMMGLCTPLFPHVRETSFPSDHASLLFSAALYLSMDRKCFAYGIPLSVVAILTAWGRVYCGIHFPFDMVGSFAVGLISAGFIHLLNRWLHPFNKRLVFVSEQLFHTIVRVLRSYEQ